MLPEEHSPNVHMQREWYTSSKTPLDTDHINTSCCNKHKMDTVVLTLQRSHFPILSGKQKSSHRPWTSKFSPLTTRSKSEHEAHRSTPDRRKASSTSSKQSIQGTAIRLLHTKQSGNFSETVGPWGLCTDLHFLRKCRGMSSTRIPR